MNRKQELDKLRTIYLTWDKDPHTSKHLLMTESHKTEFLAVSVFPEKRCPGEPDPPLDAHLLQGKKRSNAKHPKMAKTLFQALLWFHEGCRQPFPPMATANYISSVDALVKGKGKKGINVLLKRIIKDEYTEKTRSKIKDLYDSDRSRIYHGTSDVLGFDWSSKRRTAEQLAKLCLWKYVNFYAEHEGDDDPKLFHTS